MSRMSPLSSFLPSFKECVLTSLGPLLPGLPTLGGSETSHTCNLNLCLGGGGFDCIAIYAGTAFIFDFGVGVTLVDNVGSGDLIELTTLNTQDSFGPRPLPPPFPATIIGGTGRYV